jgi:hypothetical protein
VRGHTARDRQTSFRLLDVPNVGMYLRRTQRRRRDGTVVGYLQLAQNRRVGGVTRAEVLLNLGREDRLDRDGLARLVASINRYLGEEADAVAPLGPRRGR